jgi:hypothetical protein
MWNSVTSNFVENVIEEWITYRTGKTKRERDIEEWMKTNTTSNAASIRVALKGCKHIIEVNWHKIYKDSHDFFGWSACKEFRDLYSSEVREIGDFAVVCSMRGVYDKDLIFIDNTFGDDHVFVGTNNEYDAITIALLYK